MKHLPYERTKGPHSALRRKLSYEPQCFSGGRCWGCDMYQNPGPVWWKLFMDIVIPKVIRSPLPLGFRSLCETATSVRHFLCVIYSKPTLSVTQEEICWSSSRAQTQYWSLICFSNEKFSVSINYSLWTKCIWATFLIFLLRYNIRTMEKAELREISEFDICIPGCKQCPYQDRFPSLQRVLSLEPNSCPHSKLTCALVSVVIIFLF